MEAVGVGVYEVGYMVYLLLIDPNVYSGFGELDVEAVVVPDRLR